MFEARALPNFRAPPIGTGDFPGRPSKARIMTDRAMKRSA
jgi:hypothetical protein